MAAASGSVLVAATQQAKAVKGEDGFIHTEPFLALCRLVLPVVDRLGVSFMPVKSDINGNIERLARRYAQDPQRFRRLFGLVQDEVLRSEHTGSSSCTKGLLWLKRAMEFMLGMLRRMGEDPGLEVKEAVTLSYKDALAPFHGFFSSNLFSMAFNFLPYRQDFVESLNVAEGEDAQAQMLEFVAAFGPIIAEVHKFMADEGHDDPAKV